MTIIVTIIITAIVIVIIVIGIVIAIIFFLFIVKKIIERHKRRRLQHQVSQFSALQRVQHQMSQFAALERDSMQAPHYNEPSHNSNLLQHNRHAALRLLTQRQSCVIPALMMKPKIGSKCRWREGVGLHRTLGRCDLMS